MEPKTYSYSWQPKSLACLGIKFTPRVASLYKPVIQICFLNCCGMWKCGLVIHWPFILEPTWCQLMQLTPLYSWFYKPDWIVLEAQACGLQPIDLLMWFPYRNRRAILCPTLFHSLYLWDLTCRLTFLQSPHIPATPPFHNPAFLPGLYPQEFQRWLNKGLYHIGHFFWL